VSSLVALAKSAISAAIIPLGLIGLRPGRKLSPAWRVLLTVALTLIVVFLVYHQLRVLAAKVHNPPQWDFLALWLYGKATAMHLDIYRPGFAAQIAAPFHPDASFRREVIDVGFVYPPTSIWLFLPLGWLGYHGAAALWAAVNLVILLADAYLLWRLFADGGRRDLLALLAAAAILFKLPATPQTIDFLQSNFIALLAVLLLLKDRDNARGGLWLALAFMAKPFLGLMFVYALLRRKWVAALVGAGSLVLVAIGSWIVLGTQTMVTYVANSPYSRQPSWVFTEKTNQSLLATILRATRWAGEYPPTHNPVYLALSAALIAVTVALILRARDRDDWAFALALLVGLLVYPGTQFFYSDLLIIPALMLWNLSRPSTIASAAVLVFITAEFIAIAQTPAAVFVATAANWCIFAVMAAAWPRAAVAQLEPE